MMTTYKILQIHDPLAGGWEFPLPIPAITATRIIVVDAVARHTGAPKVSWFVRPLLALVRMLEEPS
jgi:hypothetical protein